MNIRVNKSKLLGSGRNRQHVTELASVFMPLHAWSQVHPLEFFSLLMNTLAILVDTVYPLPKFPLLVHPTLT